MINTRRGASDVVAYAGNKAPGPRLNIELKAILQGESVHRCSRVRFKDSKRRGYDELWRIREGNL